MGSTLASLVRDELGRLLAPLSVAALVPDGTVDILRAVGRSGSLEAHGGLATELQHLAALVEDIATLDDELLGSWEGIARVLEIAGGLAETIRGLETVVTDPQLAAHAAGLGADLVAWLVGLHLRANHPRLFRVAALLTLITPAEELPAAPIELEGNVIQRLPWRTDRIERDRLADLIDDPGAMLRATYFPNDLQTAHDAHLLAQRLFPALHELARVLGLAARDGLIPAVPAPVVPSVDEEPYAANPLGGPVVIDAEGTADPGQPPAPPDPTRYEHDFLRQLTIELLGVPTDDGQPSPVRIGVVATASSAEHPGSVKGLILAPQIGGAWTETRGDWKLSLTADGALAALVLGPTGVSFAPLTTPATHATASLVVEREAAEGTPAFVFGSSDGTRVEIGTLRFAVDAEASAARQALAISFDATSAAFVLAAGDGDGVLQRILPRDGVRARFDAGLTLSTDRGLELRGGFGLEATIPVGASVGPVRLDAIELGVRAEGRSLRIAVGASGAVTLGPITARVSGIGIIGEVAFPDGGGNLGPAQLDIGFKPPDGFGLAFESSTVTLGGYLRREPERGRYVGGLELRLFEKLDLTAIGILTAGEGTTFSLLVLIGTRFPRPIPLGYNLYLSAIGGLLGVNRTVDVDRVRSGLRDGITENLLFPKNIVAQMDSLVADLEQVFPIKTPQFVIGPTARLEWNTPPVITADIGLFLELPDPFRIVVVGALRAAIPTAAHPIVDLKAAFTGTFDLQRFRLAFDASLYDSFIGVGSFKATLEGDLAMRASWGAQRDLVATVGGFHPSYHPPAYLQLPAQRRVTISLLKDNPRLTLRAYVALTANTAQIGAELDFYFGVSSFSIVGNLGFDALFQVLPFGFKASVRASVAVRAGSRTLFSIALALDLEGTSPWRARGKASFKICWFISIDVHFDKTWGSLVEIVLPLVEVLPRVVGELQQAARWTSALAVGTSAPARLRGASGAARVDPSGVLQISQPVAPLGTQLSRFGAGAPADASRIDIRSVSVNGRALDTTPSEDTFAPAWFRAMDDRDRLQAAPFESCKNGVVVGGAPRFTSPSALGRDVSYEQIVSDASGIDAMPTRSETPARRDHFEALVPGGAVGRSTASHLRARDRERGRVQPAQTVAPRFAVVERANLRAASPESGALTRSAAEQRLRALVAEGRAVHELDIVPDYERAS